ncbi:MAG: SGNH/GDSL hydrolase family protein [Alphaproteobacteria bacterium]|nr:SGNH/GDSL hydrolase family protein [Alphaproteobacteria bacterium]
MEASSAWAPVLLILLALGPWLAGRAMGRATSWRAGRLALAGAVAAVVVVVVDLRWGTVSAWDLVFMVVAAWLGAVTARVEPRSVLASLGSATLFLVVVEVVGRMALPAPHLAPDPDWSLFPRGSATTGWAACELMYPSLGLPDFENDWRRHGARPGDPVVLHVGDSMLVFGELDHGSMSDLPGRFVARMDDADPHRTHVNLGQPGTALDVGLMALPPWVDRYDVRAVVLYFFADNDLSDLDRRYPCCRGGLLFDYGDQAVPRCPTPDGPLFGSQAVQDLLFRSGPPLVVRVATRWSPVWRHVRGRLDAFARHGTPWATTPDTTDDDLAHDAHALDEAWRRYRLLLERARDGAAAGGYPLVVVDLPVGPDLSRAGGPPSGDAWERSRTFEALCDTLGLVHVDAWQAMSPDAADDRWFLHDGYHLSAAGHARLGAWLTTHLLPLLDGDPVPPQDVRDGTDASSP